MELKRNKNEMSCQDQSRDSKAGGGNILSSHHGRGGRRIYHAEGCWWFDDLCGQRRVKLDPIFEKIGWRMSGLAEYLGLGNRTLARLVEGSVGVKGKLWIRNIRIVLVCRLLREGMKIEVVATALGFGRHSDLTREFKKLMGTTPSEYIRMEQLHPKAVIGTKV
jgi:AraC-like DNA-binding protein